MSTATLILGKSGTGKSASHVWTTKKMADDENRRIEIALMMAAIYEARAHDAYAAALEIEGAVNPIWLEHASNHRRFAAQYRDRAKRRLADSRRYSAHSAGQSVAQNTGD